MQKLHENFHIFHFQKRLVSAETIRGNTVYGCQKNLYQEAGQAFSILSPLSNKQCTKCFLFWIIAPGIDVEIGHLGLLVYCVTQDGLYNITTKITTFN